MENNNLLYTNSNEIQSNEECKANDRDITLKPKPIKARNVESNVVTYQPVPSIYSSPKNPIGVTPFQPTGNSVAYRFLANESIFRNVSTSLGGAFKTMPASPKSALKMPNEIKQEDDPKTPIHIKQEVQSPYNINGVATVFTFTAPHDQIHPDAGKNSRDYGTNGTQHHAYLLQHALPGSGTVEAYVNSNNIQSTGSKGKFEAAAGTKLANHHTKLINETHENHESSSSTLASLAEPLPKLSSTAYTNTLNTNNSVNPPTSTNNNCAYTTTIVLTNCNNALRNQHNIPAQNDNRNHVVPQLSNNNPHQAGCDADTSLQLKLDSLNEIIQSSSSTSNVFDAIILDAINLNGIRSKALFDAKETPNDNKITLEQKSPSAGIILLASSSLSDLMTSAPSSNIQPPQSSSLPISSLSSSNSLASTHFTNTLSEPRNDIINHCSSTNAKNDINNKYLVNDKSSLKNHAIFMINPTTINTAHVTPTATTPQHPQQQQAQSIPTNQLIGQKHIMVQLNNSSKVTIIFVLLCVLLK